MTAVRAAIAQSSADFAERVWPLVSEWLGGGTLIPVEGYASTQAGSVLDREAGIDAWQIVEMGNVRGIASRCQYGPRPWPSFTIRSAIASGAPTEVHKRQAALQHEQVYPHITFQSYLTGPGGDVLLVLMMQTRDLYDFVARCLEGHGLPVKVNPVDGHQFYVVWERYLRAAGFEVRTWTPQSDTLQMALL